MYTKEDKAKDSLGKIVSQYDDNLINVFGTGSFFYQDLSQGYDPQKDRTIDFHLVVKDVEQFYQNHIITQKELDSFGIRSDDVESIDSLLQTFKQKNELIPLYHLNEEEGYRITVMPYHKIDEWTSNDSPIGYFLTGRWQKPMREFLTSQDPRFLLGDKFQKIYEKGVELAINTSYGEYSTEDLVKEIYTLSYIAEGRGIGSKEKAEKIFESCRDESLNIYRPLIDKHFNTNLNTFTIPTSKRQAKQNKREFKKWGSPRAARVRHNLNEAFPNGDDFAARKIARFLKLNDENSLSRSLGLALLQPLKLYQSYQLTKLSEE